MYDFTQQMVDSVFSFGELGFQEFETQRYLTGILEKEGFTIEKGVAGIPTAWTARFGSGKPVIALGSDVDCIPQASQKPGVAYRAPMIVGAPGHGEGHNSGVPLNITAAIAVKRIMEREKLSGTLVLWPGSPKSSSAPRRITCVKASSKTLTSCSTTTSAAISERAGARAAATGSFPSNTPSTAKPRTARARPGAAAARWMPSS